MLALSDPTPDDRACPPGFVGFPESEIAELKEQVQLITAMISDMKMQSKPDRSTKSDQVNTDRRNFVVSAYIRCMSLLETQLTFRTRQKFSRPIPAAFSLVMTSTFTFKTVRTVVYQSKCHFLSAPGCHKIWKQH
jgi:hypothetical protein